MENLSTTEIDVLLESLDAWEVKDNAGLIITTVFGAMMSKGDPVEQEKMREETKEQIAKEEAAKKIRKETSVLIKAKLITMKHEMDINKIVDSKV